MAEKFYNEQIAELRITIQKLKKRRVALAWGRFACVLAMLACLYLLYGKGIVILIVLVLLIAIIFIKLLFIDLKNKTELAHNHHLVIINENELKALKHNYYHFSDGANYIQKEHLYANDLDLFGHASLYQYINRTNSQLGAGTLASWLLTPAKRDTILQRQQAIKELVTQQRWRQKLQAYGAVKEIRTETQNRLEEWFAEESIFFTKKLWRWLQYLLPLVVVSVVILSFSTVINTALRNYCLLASALIALSLNKKVALVHTKVSKISDELEVLSESIRLIENTDFSSPLLQQMQSSYKNEAGAASEKLNQLKKILERLDMRYNFVVYIPLAILFQWDLQQVIALEKWKAKNHKDVIEWFTILGEFEALNSLAILSFNHPDWCFPEFKTMHFYINGKEIGHPLIRSDKCVTNPINIESDGKLMLVTGSNMAGKSTYLRSIGVNCVLAMAGAPVYASYFCLSPIQLLSSMRIADNLEESTSTFYAELKKLKTVIDKVNKNEKVFILLDEILRGTNSLDRHTGSAALIKQLIKQNAVGIIATHDIELAEIKNEYPSNILNYHFDVKVTDGELYFDYQLKEGVCNSLNASILMKKIGIEL